MLSRFSTNNYLLTEEAVHYVAAFLERYEDKHPTKNHQAYMKEFRELSNKLLETLEQKSVITIYRHKLNKD